MYKHILKARDQIFEEGIKLPLAAPHACANGLNVGNKLGMLACTLTAGTLVRIAAGAAITVSLQHADTAGGPYADCSAHSVTLADALSVSHGGLVTRVVLPPDTKPWIKAQVDCDDADASGSIDVFIEYLAR
jgi:hypothetical protein